MINEPIDIDALFESEETDIEDPNEIKEEENIECHELASIFPMMNDVEFKNLCEDIMANGLREPIALYENKILDGRNRYKACKELAIEPEYVEFKGDPLKFVISLNLHRRHLNESQRALIASRLANMQSGARTDLEPSADLRKVPNEISQPNAAKMLNVSDRSIQNIKRIEREAPEKISEIEAGNIAADKVIRDIRSRQREEARIQETKKIIETQAIIYKSDSFKNNPLKQKCDLLLTDPLYSTDVKDISAYAQNVTNLISNVKDTGRAFIFTGSYPGELHAYLSAEIPKSFKLVQILVWSCKNTMGPSPKMLYKNNWQAIFYYIGKNAEELNCPELNELFAVKEINAPDGRLGDRYHTFQKPVELAEQLIRHSTKPGALIYDPFAGTGTFLIASQKLGRQAIGCELNDEMIKICEERGLKCQIM